MINMSMLDQKQSEVFQLANRVARLRRLVECGCLSYREEYERNEKKLQETIKKTEELRAGE